MKKIILIIVMVVLLSGISACSSPTAAPLPTPTSTFSPLILLPTQEATAQLPTPTLPSLPTPTLVPFTPIAAETNVDNLQLREGPGRMFASVDAYKIGSRVTMLARESGNNWILVQTSDFQSGWMKVEYLTFTGDVTPLPVITVPDVQVVHGRVWTISKDPAYGVGVSIARVENKSPDREDVAMTNQNGEWYLYLPLDFDGNWVIGPNSYSEKSNIVDSSGNMVGLWPGATLITLPLKSDVSFEFAFHN